MLYHASRRPEQDGTSHTAAQLRVATRLLERWDKTFVDLLVEHIGSVGVEKTSYRKKLMRLFRQERFITPQEALNLFLIDRVEP